LHSASLPQNFEKRGQTVITSAINEKTGFTAILPFSGVEGPT